MSQNSSKESSETVVEVSAPKEPRPISMKHKILAAIFLPAWVLFSFFISQLILSLALLGLKAVGVSLAAINQIMFNTFFAILVYALSLLIIVGVPYLALKRKTVTVKELGFTRLPSWTDIFMAPVGFVVYLVLSATLTAIAVQFLPGFDVAQTQDTGFSGLVDRYQYVLAFLTLVVLAPLAEEVLFRGYLFGKLKKYLPLWLSIIITSLVFGLAHGAWNVGIDVFALSIILCLLREISGSLWPSILLHMLKNGIAFYFLFINPLFLHTLGG